MKKIPGPLRRILLSLSQDEGEETRHPAFRLVKSGSLSFSQLKADGLFKKPPLPSEGFTFQGVPRL
jgi:hypothetical protein